MIHLVLTHQETARLRTIVRQIINASDPMSLLEMGAPEDEYDTEIDEIVEECLQVGPDEEAIARAVQNTFDRMFSPASVPLARSKFIAAQICNLWPSQNQQGAKPD